VGESCDVIERAMKVEDEGAGVTVQTVKLALEWLSWIVPLLLSCAV